MVRGHFYYTCFIILVYYTCLKLIKGDDSFKLETRTDNRTRAGGRSLMSVFPHTERFKKSITYEVPKIWNALPSDTRDNLYPQAFKANVIKHYWVIQQHRLWSTRFNTCSQLYPVIHMRFIQGIRLV